MNDEDGILGFLKALAFFAACWFALWLVGVFLRLIGLPYV